MNMVGKILTIIIFLNKITTMKIVKGSYSVVLLIENYGMICFRDIFE